MIRIFFHPYYLKLEFRSEEHYLSPDKYKRFFHEVLNEKLFDFERFPILGWKFLVSLKNKDDIAFLQKQFCQKFPIKTGMIEFIQKTLKFLKKYLLIFFLLFLVKTLLM